VGGETSLDGGFPDQELNLSRYNFCRRMFQPSGWSDLFVPPSANMSHIGRNKILKAKPENNPSRFTGQHAQRTLDEVRERYGIRQSGSPAHVRVNTASSAPKEPAKQEPRPTLRLEPSITETPFVAVEPMRFGPHLELGGVRRPDIPPSGSPSDNQSFHYLIRIAECALTLYCEVTADSEATAKHHVKQIPNLMEWREISGAELAEIISNERTGSAGVKPAPASRQQRRIGAPKTRTQEEDR
jgi:hypothetical protein